MKKLLLNWGSISLLFFTVNIFYGQKAINLKLLVNDWAISYNESRDSILILRNIDSKFLTHEDKRIVYPFKTGKDSLISKIRFPNYRFYCIVGVELDSVDSSNYGLAEIWFLNREKMFLRHTICLNVKEEEYNSCIYESIYRIKNIKEGYLELFLEKELVIGL